MDVFLKLSINARAHIFLFSQHGKLTRVFIQRCKSLGRKIHTSFVRFDSQVAACSTIQFLNGRNKDRRRFFISVLGHISAKVCFRSRYKGLLVAG